MSQDHTAATTPTRIPVKDAAGCESCCGAPVRLRPASAPVPPAHGEAGHDHDHDHAHGDEGGDGHDHGPLPALPRIIAALVVAVLAELSHLLLPETTVGRIGGMALAAVAIALAGTGIYRSGLKSLLRGKLGIDALMAVAVTGAFLIGQWPEAAMVMALYALAEFIEHKAADRARNAIGGLMALAPDEAEVRGADGAWQRAAVRSVTVDAVVRIRPGERVPLDGVVTAGNSAVDQASVTGESIPVDKAVGDAVFAATVNQTGELEMRVTAAAGHTTLDRIIESVEQAQASRAPTQRFIERFAAVYTPTVFVLAVLVAVLPPLLLDWAWLDAIYKALVLLVIACPCALVISTPVTVVSGLTAAARRGILIKGGTHLEGARKLRAVALDKTGTLTEGKPVLVAFQAWGGADEAQARSAAGSLAARSDHPVSKAIAAGIDLPREDVADVRAMAGRGTEGRIGERTLVLGNLRLIDERGLRTDALVQALAEHERQGRTVTLLADAHAVLGLFAVADTVKAGSRQAVADLKAMGVTPVMLTGDNALTARAVADAAGIDDARGDLLPEDKLKAVQAMRQRYGMTGMTGDGINDAPALAQADIGFAMGAAGTDIAMEAADVVIMNDDLGRIADTIRLSRRTHTVLWQNISLALGIKVVFFALAVFGSATMWMAVFADMGASLLVVANGLRLLRTRF
ncbi:heavy metal translocating P-type ATPase [Variovorax guangxiensis]|uniref:P-type Zn(2+) transporter n=1 Tax=Variovorax guangxiensis TaxID=1775474 RepID=A0A502DZW1_9BURK|nr:heavy metal translocating P-type ATPase [Variovorax guangxiensis]TPG26267.1 heavy metal translocating P-type ATPase [Variovorax ginsengisoli]TPG29992.1 heavy metal translocating P-type ATPase [Variovorax guangxiensis]